MARRITRQLLEQLVQTVNEDTNLSITLDYCRAYGGYALLDTGKSSRELRFITLQNRMGASEMYYYLCGVLNGIRSQRFIIQ